MTTNRAKRLERALSQRGWDTGIGGSAPLRHCKCGVSETRSDAKFCRACGTKLPRFESGAKAVYAELEEAIAYALGEKA